jgi:hypothetical protein
MAFVGEAFVGEAFVGEAFVGEALATNKYTDNIVEAKASPTLLNDYKQCTNHHHTAKT